MNLADVLDAGWRIAITHPEQPTPVCAATILTPRITAEDLEYRAGCLGCGWVADDTDQSENLAVERAHDHTHPGYRTLPAVDLPTGWRANPTSKTVTAARAMLAEFYPPEWITTGFAPSWSYRPPRAGRHVPGGGVFGGYDLARPQPLDAGEPIGVGSQGALF